MISENARRCWVPRDSAAFRSLHPWSTSRAVSGGSGESFFMSKVFELGRVGQDEGYSFESCIFFIFVLSQARNMGWSFEKRELVNEKNDALYTTEC